MFCFSDAYNDIQCKLLCMAIISLLIFIIFWVVKIHLKAWCYNYQTQVQTMIISTSNDYWSHQTNYLFLLCRTGPRVNFIIFKIIVQELLSPGLLSISSQDTLSRSLLDPWRLMLLNKMFQCKLSEITLNFQFW